MKRLRVKNEGSGTIRDIFGGSVGPGEEGELLIPCAEGEKTWIDFAPEEDRQLALAEPEYAAALRKTMVGAMAELKAAAWPLGEPFRQLLRRVQRHRR